MKSFVLAGVSRLNFFAGHTTSNRILQTLDQPFRTCMLLTSHVSTWNHILICEGTYKQTGLTGFSVWFQYVKYSQCNGGVGLLISIILKVVLTICGEIPFESIEKKCVKTETSAVFCYVIRLFVAQLGHCLTITCHSSLQCESLDQRCAHSLICSCRLIQVI